MSHPDPPGHRGAMGALGSDIFRDDEEEQMPGKHGKAGRGRARRGKSGHGKAGQGKAKPKPKKKGY